MKAVYEDDEVEEQDSLGLEEATQRDDDEFQPSLTHQEEEDDDLEDVEDEEEMDDEDWDVKRGGEWVKTTHTFITELPDWLTVVMIRLELLKFPPF